MIQTAEIQPPDPQKMRRQAYLLGLVAVIMSGFGFYLVAAGALPSQYNLVMGEPVPAIESHTAYDLSVFQLDLAAPRFMVGHPQLPILLVAERGAGRVIALQDSDDDRRADGVQVVIDHLATPTGLAFHDDWLYVAEANQITRARLDGDLQVIEREVVVKNLPVGKNPNEVESNQHALLIHDDELYVSIGASCATCQETDSRRGTVMVYDLDGSNERVFARGLYQVLGLAVNPVSQQIWASNQGRPLLLDDPAPETIYALQLADHAGFPACVGGNQIAPELAIESACDDVVQPLARFEPQANVTNLIFLDHPQVPAAYQGDLLFSLHGGVIGEGRNGLQAQIGIFRLEIDEAGQLVGEHQPFVSGFWKSDEPGDYLGRTFGLAMLMDGTLFISDDASGAVYQLRWRE